MNSNAQTEFLISQVAAINNGTASTGAYFNVPTIDQIMHDLADCCIASKVKTNKRWGRFVMICKIMDIIPDEYLRDYFPGKSIQEEVVMEDVSEQSLEFLKTPHEFTIGTVIIEDGTLADAPKKCLEAALTAAANSNLHMYRSTCAHINKLLIRLKSNPILRKYFASKDILFILKGGIVQRLVITNEILRRKFTPLVASAYIKEVNQKFAFGGDNDTGFLVNPSLREYVMVRTLLVHTVYSWMMEKLNDFTTGTFSQMYRSIKSIDVGENRLEVTPAPRPHFIMQRVFIDGEMKSEMLSMPNDEPVFVSMNDTLDFIDDIGRRAKFTLIRYKGSYRVTYVDDGIEYSRVLGAELLDIAIPHRKESKLDQISFDKYQNGTWIQSIQI